MSRSALSRAMWGTGLAIVALALAAAGCGSSSSGGNGITDRSARDIAHASLDAATNAKTVHLVASITSNGEPLHFDIKIVKGKGGAGSFTASGLSFNLIRIGDKAYFNAGNAFWTHFGNHAAAQLFAGKWMVASARTGDFASFTKLTDLGLLLAKARSHTGTVTKGKTTTVDGQRAIEIRSSKGSSLFVATTGPPYPLKLTAKPPDGGSLLFEEWNQPVTLKAPPNPIDYDQLKSLG